MGNRATSEIDETAGESSEGKNLSAGLFFSPYRDQGEIVNLHIADAVVLITYLAGITVLGAWAGRKISSVAEYFMPRRFGRSAMIMHAFGTGTASDQAVTVAAATASNGLSGIWLQWMWLFCTPFYWLLAPIMRRFRTVTTASVYEMRYDRSVAVLFACVGIVSLSVKIGVMLKGAGALLESGTGGVVNVDVAIPVITVLFVIYGMIGGLGGAIVTDFIQGILTLVFSFMLLPVMLWEVGGISGIRRVFAGSGMEEQMMSLVAPEGIGAFYIVMLSVNSLFLIVSIPSVMGNCAAGRTELDGRIGFMVGNIMKRVCTVAWSLTAIAAVAWYVRQGITVSPDALYGDIAHRFLPELLPGFLGLFIASLLAAVMSSCDTFMVASAGLFTENIYRPLKPDASQQQLMRAGRCASLFVVVSGVVMAYLLPDVVAGLKVWLKVGPMIGIPFWLGLLWRRTSVAGAWASTLTGFLAWWLLSQSGVAQSLAQHTWITALGCVQIVEGVARIPDPWLIAGYLSSGIMSGILISLVTPAVCEKKLDRFYFLSRTPILPEEELSLPQDSGKRMANSVPQRAMLCRRFGLEIPAPSGTSIRGFLAGWISIGFLIGGFWFLLA